MLNKSVLGPGQRSSFRVDFPAIRRPSADESSPSSVKLCRTAPTLSAEVNATVAIRATPPLSRKERYRR